MTTYRHAATDGDDGPGIDGVMFATTDYGDCYCLDLADGNEEPAVHQYLHEGGYFEPYAGSFAECVLRFAAGD